MAAARLWRRRNRGLCAAAGCAGQRVQAGLGAVTAADSVACGSADVAPIVFVWGAWLDKNRYSHIGPTPIWPRIHVATTRWAVLLHTAQQPLQASSEMAPQPTMCG